LLVLAKQGYKRVALSKQCLHLGHSLLPSSRAPFSLFKGASGSAAPPKYQEALPETCSTKFTVIAVTGPMRTLRTERKEQGMFENFDKAKATT
jgi:hypothetical protein